MATQAQPKPNAPNKPAVNAPRTLVGWQGLRFTLPPDWNVTGFSMDAREGYLKVDSPGTMFAQIKWSDLRGKRPANLAELVFRLWQKARRKPPAEPTPPDLRAMLDAFLKATEKQARKGRAAFDCKIRPEEKEAQGERIAHPFSWTGGGQGHGKIWHCKTCGRVVIAQVVGQGRDPVANVAAELFGEMRDHPEAGWNTWALYDLAAGIPEDFTLKSQKLMSGYLRLEFERRGERILLERWGLANITRKKFTLAEWFASACNVHDQRVETSETTVQGHPAACATGRIRGLLIWVKTLREAVRTFRPASQYDGCCWECPEANKLYAVQVWHNVRAEGLMEEVAARCACH